DRDALEQRFAERLLDDESLRADLTDDEYQPIQDWALDRLHAQAGAVDDPKAPEAETAMGNAVESVRQVLLAVDDAVGHRPDRDAQAFAAGLAPLVEAVAPPLYADETAAGVRQAVQEAIPRVAAQKDDLDGPALVQALVSALTVPTDAPAAATDSAQGSE